MNAKCTTTFFWFPLLARLIYAGFAARRLAACLLSWPLKAMSDDTTLERNVRRRVERELPPLPAAISNEDSSLLDLSWTCGAHLCALGTHLSNTESNSIYQATSNAPIHSVQNGANEIMRAMLKDLGSWVDSHMPPYEGLSEGRRAKWEGYCTTERWVYYSVHLMNGVMRWRSDDKSVFLFLPELGDTTAPMFETNCYEQVTWIIALANMWNASEYNTTSFVVNLAMFTSLEHFWFGYQRLSDLGATHYVHMSIDQSEDESRLIVNRLESSADFNDFECIAYQNTLLEAFEEADNKPAPLSVADLRCLLLNHFSSALLAQYKEHIETNALEDGTVPDRITQDLMLLQDQIWQRVVLLRRSPTDTTMGSVVALQIGSILQAGIAPSESISLPYSSELEAYSAALEKNPANYEARKCVVECYLDMGELYLAHQHCLVLVEQLSEYANAALEAPKAHVAYAFAAELVATTLQDIHVLHERAEEGYEQLYRIPTIGDSVEVEWALDDELVRYTGKIEMHPDFRSLCISYPDDTERGTHRRRFENALHLVNTNDPQDMYLETYYLVQDAVVE